MYSAKQGRGLPRAQEAHRLRIQVGEMLQTFQVFSKHGPAIFVWLFGITTDASKSKLAIINVGMRSAHFVASIPRMPSTP